MEIDELSVEEIYQAIGRAVLQGIEEEWRVAMLEAELEPDADDTGLFLATYEPATAVGKVRDFDVHPEILDLFLELRKRFAARGKPGFIKAKLVLERSGKFDLQLTYPGETE